LVLSLLSGASADTNHKNHGKMNGKCKCTNPACDVESTYSEGQIVGYRWYDKHNVQPAFAFGHGLTYGNFSYSALTASSTSISFTVTRTSGSTGSCDTPQVYFSYPGAKGSTDPSKPDKVLRFFKKVCEPTAVLSFDVSTMDVSNWDVGSSSWKKAVGTFGVQVGTSSKNIALTSSFTV
jgi:beta-glucosidase